MVDISITKGYISNNIQYSYYIISGVFKDENWFNTNHFGLIRHVKVKVIFEYKLLFEVSFFIFIIIFYFIFMMDVEQFSLSDYFSNFESILLYLRLVLIHVEHNIMKFFLVFRLMCINRRINSRHTHTAYYGHVYEK